MKKIIPCLLAIVACVSLSFGVWDYEIHGGYPSDITLTNSESLLMTGGGIESIFANDSSYIEIQGTAPLQIDVGGIVRIAMNDQSSIEFYNGELGQISLYDSATAVFKGGKINSIRSYQTVGWLEGEPVGQHIEMVVKDYNYVSSTKMLTGTWGDDSAFSIQLVNQTGYTAVIDNIKFTIIPEPLTLALMGLGGLLIRRR